MSKRIKISYLGVVLTFFAAAIGLMSATPYATLATRAERFYTFGEWESAAAMYELMLAERSDDVRVYARSIVVSGMLDRSDEQIAVVEQSQSAGIALVEIFALVKKDAYSLCHPEIYERLLLTIKECQPWLRRSINVRLSEYYDSRNNAPKMVEYADTLLRIRDDDVEALAIRARGLMLQSRYDDAMATYRAIIAVDSTAVDACINLGVYYRQLSRGDLHDAPPTVNAADSARRYLCRAHALRPTPHLKKLIDSLER